jgi:6-phosphogluconolactonase (cycloisomerase 2 family)
LAFHPHRPLAYVVNELDSSVTAYRFDAASGALDPFQVVPMLPDSFVGNSRAAGIAIDASGRFLYSSNRGGDSVAVFAIDGPSGCLRFLGAEPTRGKTPRCFALAPNGRFLFALNEDSDAIVTFAVDARTGALAATGAQLHCGSPVCMVFSA